MGELPLREGQVVLSRSQDPKEPVFHGAELESDPQPIRTWASEAPHMKGKGREDPERRR